MPAITSNDPMIEVIPGASPASSLPQPVLEMTPLAKIPDSSESGKNKLLLAFGSISIITAIANIFGAFGFLNSQCSVDKCNSDATRINWLDIHNIGNEMGWSLPYPELGIPDYVALVCGILVLVVALRKK